jgi:hypothetical protein
VPSSAAIWIGFSNIFPSASRTITGNTGARGLAEQDLWAGSLSRAPPNNRLQRSGEE